MKKMYSINDIGAQLGLPSREAPGPRGMSLEYLWDIAAADRFIALLNQDGADPITLDGHPQAWLACYLALELRRGIVERVFERTATGFATWSLDVDPMDPLRMTIYIRPLNEANPKPLSTTLHFFGGAAEAAGGYVREVPSSETPETLGELLEQLSAESPELARILSVSSYLVNERSARPDSELAPGARVDVLPPFAGG